MKKTFTVFAVITAVFYGFTLYYLLFRLIGREMVVVSQDMLEYYNYWNSVNLIPFRTIYEYVTAIAEGSIRGHAVRNLCGNLFLFLPMGFYLPFLARELRKLKTYCVVMAAAIIAVEIIQLATKSGSLDIDDFTLNYAGALLGFFVFTRTPIRRVFNLRT